MTEGDQIRELCAKANESWGTDLAYVGVLEGSHVIESATKRYTGHGTVDMLRHMIHAFAGGWLAARSL